MGARIEMINKIKNFKKASDGVKASVVYTLSSLFTRGLAIITVPVFTRLMSSEEIGIVNLYNSWFAMISVVTTLSLTSGGFQLAMKEFRNERNQYVSSVLTLTSAMAGLTFLIYLIKPSFWNNITGLPTGVMLLLLVDLLFSPAQSFWLSRQRYEYKYKAVAAVSFLSALAASVLSVIVVVWGSNRNYSNLGCLRLYANYAVLLSVAAWIWVSIYVKGKTIYNKKYWQFSLRLSIPLIGNAVASQILSVSDRTMISKMVGNSAVGIYSTLYTVSSLSLIIWQAINASFVPFLFENIDNPEKEHDIKKLSSELLVAFAVVAFLLTVMAPEIVAILATREYYEAIYIMPPICAGVFLTSLSNMYTNVLIYHKKTSFVMISSIVAAIVNIVLNLIGIRVFGYMAAAYTTLIAYIILAVMQGIVSTKVHKQVSGNDNAEVYDTKFVYSLAVLTIVICTACVILYQYTILRYSIFGLIVILAIVNRKRIASILRKKHTPNE